MRRRPGIVALENLGRAVVGLPRLQPLVVTHAHVSARPATGNLIIRSGEWTLAREGAALVGGTGHPLASGLKAAFGSVIASGGEIRVSGHKSSEDAAVVTESSQVERHDTTTVEARVLAVTGLSYAITYNLSGDNAWVALALSALAGYITWAQTRW